MSWFNLLGIAVGVAMDAFAVAVAVGVSLESVTPRRTLRLAFHFGLFQFVMPLIGWVIGRQMSGHTAGYDQLAAFALLSLVGMKMLWDSRRPEGHTHRGDPTKGFMLIALSLATSLDALAVGMSLALLRVSIWAPAAVIGLVAATLTMVGIYCGGRLGRAGAAGPSWPAALCCC